MPPGLAEDSVFYPARWSRIATAATWGRLWISELLPLSRRLCSVGLDHGLLEQSLVGGVQQQHTQTGAPAMTGVIKPLTLIAALALFAGPALADRPPTAEERERIEAQLGGLGFTSWEEIEWDDGYWEVDDAIGPDGVEYDLKLHPETLEIVEQERD
jgi:hypothetical protein